MIAGLKQPTPAEPPETGATFRKLPIDRDSHRENMLTDDVAPVLRRFFTRAESFFDGRLSLTLCDELIRGQVPK